MNATLNNRTSAKGGSGDPTHRTVGRVEARNTRLGRDDARFDFTVDSDPHLDGLLGLLVSYLAGAAAEHAGALDCALDVSRITLDVERSRVRSDGGTTASNATGSDTVDAPTRAETPDEADSPATAGETRVRATMEVHSDADTDRLGTWMAQLRADETPSAITPELTSLDISISAR